jgi:hypothetical protein
MKWDWSLHTMVRAGCVVAKDAQRLFMKVESNDAVVVLVAHSRREAIAN